MTHFHLADSLQGGYMPDRTAVAEDREAADRIASDWLADYEDQATDNDDSIHVEEFTDMVTVAYPDSATLLGRVITRDECEETGPDCELDG